MLAAALAALPRADGVDAVYASGEHGDALLAERKVNGIPLPPGTWQRLADAAATLDIAMPATR